mgnify:CR=1 FL=1
MKGNFGERWPAAVQLLTIGFYVAFSLIIPTLIGFFWLGPKFGHTVLFTLVGLGIGTIVMVYGVYRMLQPFLQEAKKEMGEEKLGQPVRMLLRLLPSRKKEKSNG